MKAVELVHERISYSETAFAEVVVWTLPSPHPGSKQIYKYRLAYVKGGQCVLRYDNESGKGDHRHVRGKEYNYLFWSIDRLIVDFQTEVRRMNHENSDT